jgi:hypothetical protein
MSLENLEAIRKAPGQRAKHRWSAPLKILADRRMRVIGVAAAAHDIQKNDW